MTARSSLVRSIPFWILFIGSLALTGFGAWMVIDRLTRLESSIATPPTDTAGQLATTISVYVSPAAATVGAILLGAGLIGLLLTLTVATLRSVLPAPAVEAADEMAWSDDIDDLVTSPVEPTHDPDASPGISAHAVAPADGPEPVATGVIAELEPEPVVAAEPPVPSDPVVPAGPVVPADPSGDTESKR